MEGQAKASCFKKEKEEEERGWSPLRVLNGG